jgi:hypothetical protein
VYTGTNFTVEGFIPKEVIQPKNVEEAILKLDGVLGFDIESIDNDAMINGKKSILSWNNDQGEDNSWFSINNMGKIVLKDVRTKVQSLKNGLASVTLHPNPVSSYAKVSAATEIEKIEVVDILGNRLISINNVNESDYTINVSNLKKGTYFVNISSTNGDINFKKLIKK